MKKQEIWLKKLREKIRRKFINNSIKKYGDIFTYDNLVYIDKKNLVVITCKKHGDFSMIGSAYLTRRENTSPCPGCIRDEKFKRFVLLSNKVHNGKYDYSKVKFINTTTKVEIICPIHGSFFQEPYAHYSKKQKCYQCAKDTEKNTTDNFIRMSKEKHGNKYDYSKSIYVDNKTKIEIVCPIHGSFFQRPGSHFLDGCGCSQCATDSSKVGLEKFIEISNKIHSNRYDYSKATYVGNKVKTEIICPEHGSFFQTPNSHMLGVGCPFCKISKGEESISKIFQKYNIEFKREYTFTGYRYRYDFYLPEQNILLEFHGYQHYYPIDFFGGDEGLATCKVRDKRKKQIAKQKNIPLITIKYTYQHNGTLEQKLINELKKQYKYWLKIDDKIIAIENSYKLCQYFKLPGRTLLQDALETLLKNNSNISRLF